MVTKRRANPRGSLECALVVVRVEARPLRAGARRARLPHPELVSEHGLLEASDPTRSYASPCLCFPPGFPLLDHRKLRMIVPRFGRTVVGMDDRRSACRSHRVGVGRKHWRESAAVGARRRSRAVRGSGSRPPLRTARVTARSRAPVNRGDRPERLPTSRMTTTLAGSSSLRATCPERQPTRTQEAPP
jgi:hypothetical protein